MNRVNHDQLNFETIILIWCTKRQSRDCNWKMLNKEKVDVDKAVIWVATKHILSDDLTGPTYHVSLS